MFKNQIANDQVDQISFKDHQDKNKLTLRTKMAVTKNVLKVKFDCTSLSQFGVFDLAIYKLVNAGKSSIPQKKALLPIV